MSLYMLPVDFQFDINIIIFAFLWLMLTWQDFPTILINFCFFKIKTLSQLLQRLHQNFSSLMWTLKNIKILDDQQNVFELCDFFYSPSHFLWSYFHIFCCIKAVKVTVNYGYLCFHLSKKTVKEILYITHILK